MWTLTRLTDKHGWSSLLTLADQKSLFTEVLGILLELVQAFHLECGKGGSSYMGLSITRASILCLNHVVEEMQQFSEAKVCEGSGTKHIPSAAFGFAPKDS